MTAESRMTGLDTIGSVPWATHLCIFHETRQDLLDVMIAYFREGLENNEFCLWVTSDAVTEEEAERELRKVIPNVDTLLSERRLEIVCGQKWQAKKESSARRTVIEACQARADQALARGLAGMRASWGMWPVDKRKRRAYLQYENRISSWIRGRKVLMLCAYPVEECTSGDLLDLAASHDCAASMRLGNWSALKLLQAPAATAGDSPLPQAPAAIPGYSPLAERVAATGGELSSLVADLKAELAERKARESELQRAQETFRRHFDLGLVGMSITAPSKHYLEVNNEMCEIIGYQREELLQLRWDKITHRDDLADELYNFQKMLAGEIEGYSMEKRWIRKDGDVVYSILSVNRVRPADGSIERFVTLLQDVSERKRAEEKIAAYEARLRSLASELVLAEERERQKIATNLHDSVAQLLAAAKARLAGLKDSVHLPNALRQFSAINELLSEAIMDSRLLMYDLSPPVLYTDGFQAALQWFAKRVLVQHGMRVHLEDDQLPKPLDEDILVLLFSAVRELVTNAVKHAQVGEIKVRVERRGETLSITVHDEGVGFDVSRIGSNYDVTGGFGLFSIRERLASLGGEFDIRSAPGFGTTVMLAAPLKNGNCMAA